MKTIILSFILVTFGLTMTIAQDQATTSNEGSIAVSISGLNSNKGKVFIGIYDSKSNWLGQRAFDDIVEITDQSASSLFENIPPGVYAVSIYHDENDNGKMDKNFIGIPTEDYGCSRGAYGKFGPPKWQDAQFTLGTEKADIHIQL